MTTPVFKSQGSRIILLSIILLSLCAFFFHDNIGLFPSFIHAWTQSDRYALALGFLNNGFDFFHPQTYNLLTADGITRVDFPVHEYVVALLMKVTGIHEPIVFRIYTLLYALAGLIFFFRLCELFNGSFQKNLLATLFLFLCPVYLYYADGFIPSIPSLSNLFIGYFFFFRYKKGNDIGDFRRAILFFTLAALARLPFFIFLFAVACQQIAGYLSDKKIRWKEVSALVASMLVFICYQLYNSYLGNKYGSQFLVSILPARNTAELGNFISKLWMQWRFEYLTKAQYAIAGLLLLVSVLSLVKNRVRPPKDLLIHLGIASSGSIIYFFLMLKQFPDHDYYFIDAFYPVIGLLIILTARFSFRSPIVNYGIGIALTILLAISFLQAEEVLQKRYVTGYWDRDEITRKNFTGTEKYIDSLGIAKDAKVLVLDGYTTNVPLILMNRKGWTVNWTLKENIEEGMSKPFDLVAIQNCFSPSDVLRNDMSLTGRLEKFADNGFVSFYKRRTSPNQTSDQFLGIDSSTVLFQTTRPDTVFVKEDAEFLELFSGSISKFSSAKPIKIFVTGEIQIINFYPQLVASVSSDKNKCYYFSFDVSDYVSSSQDWQPLMFQFVIPPCEDSSANTKVYFWNRRGAFAIRGLRIVAYR
jgi:hypothetical protein